MRSFNRTRNESELSTIKKNAEHLHARYCAQLLVNTYVSLLPKNDSFVCICGSREVQILYRIRIKIPVHTKNRLHQTRLMRSLNVSQFIKFVNRQVFYK